MKLGRNGLPLRSAVIARRQRRIGILVTLSAVAALAFVGAVAREMWWHRAEVAADVAQLFTSGATAEQTLAALPAPQRPVYRHSIVPGGAYSRAEVSEAMRKDAVVAAHYADIDVGKVHAQTVHAARAVYVSYRVGDTVYWTRTPLRLAPGETLLTDGHTEIRARCGNLVSDRARQPVAAAEPPAGALDQAGPETGSSTIAGERGPDGALAYLPNTSPQSGGLAMGSTRADGVANAGAVTQAPMWFLGGGSGASPYLGPNGGPGGTSLAAPFGSSGRSNRGGSNDGSGSNAGGGSNTGGSNDGGGSPGGDGPHDGDGPHAGDKELPTTTTGGTVTTTTGNVVIETGTTGGENDDVPTIPEPGTLFLMGVGVAAAASRTLRRANRR